MADRETNIDIVFRNGLRDYEVLPPAGIWESIRPAVRKKQMPFILLRSAATIALLLSIGFGVYKWNRNISDKIAGLQYTINPESENPIINIPKTAPLSMSALPVLARQEQAIQESEEDNIRTAASVTEEPSTLVSEDELLSDHQDNLSGEAPAKTNNLFVPKTGFSRYNPNPGLYYDPSESKSEQKSSDMRWSVAAIVSPTFYSGFNTDHNSLTSIIESKEQAVVSYTGGVAFAYKINKRLSVQSGVYYSSLGNELSGINSFSGFGYYDKAKGDHNFEVLTTNGTVYTTSSDVFLVDKISTVRVKTAYTADVFDPGKANLTYIDNSLTQNFSYLELPFFLKYKLVDRTLGFDLIGGLSSNFLINNAVYANRNGEKYQVGTTEGMNPVAFSSSLGMGMEYNFTKNISINLEPTFRYYINPFSGSEDLRLHPYSFGIFSGLSYRF